MRNTKVNNGNFNSKRYTASQIQDMLSRGVLSGRENEHRIPKNQAAETADMLRRGVLPPLYNR